MFIDIRWRNLVDHLCSRKFIQKYMLELKPVDVRVHIGLCAAGVLRQISSGRPVVSTLRKQCIVGPQSRLSSTQCWSSWLMAINWRRHEPKQVQRPSVARLAKAFGSVSLFGGFRTH